MTNDEKKKAYCLLLDGKTYQEVADIIGVSKQCIHKHFGDKVGFRKRTLTHLQNQVYPNITRFMSKKQISRSQFAKMCDIQYDALLAILRGDREPKKSEIDKVLAATNMTYEEAFKEKEE